ncbi:MAG: 3'-5' exonuclease [Candidatus Thiodiazotropha sp.]
MYGQHDTCGEWCRFGKMKDYKHSGLPRGSDLTDTLLRTELENVIQTYVEQAQKLITTGDSQANESLNNSAWSKAPKTRNYTGSESFSFRIAAAVCQFNDGKKYVGKVLDTANLTPQKLTQEHNDKEDRLRQYAKTYKKVRKNKRRRIELRKERTSKQISAELREGTTYATNCANVDEEKLDTDSIPEPLEYYPVTSACTDNVISKIYYDTETTGLGETAEITQLSAYFNSEDSFSYYVMPKGDISRRASDVTGLSIIADNSGTRRMYLNNQEVQTVDLATCLAEFNGWLRSVPGDIKLLIAHNGKIFDMPLLIRSFHTCSLQDEFCLSVSGFVDTLPILRKLLPRRNSYKLTALHEDIIGEPFQSHNAIADVQALSAVTNSLPVTDKVLLEFSINTSSAYMYVNERKQISDSVNNLEAKLSQAISKSMIRKIARNGLSYSHLLRAYERDSENGIKYLFTEKVGKKIRVTNREAVIKGVVNHFRQVKGDNK